MRREGPSGWGCQERLERRLGGVGDIAWSGTISYNCRRRKRESGWATGSACGTRGAAAPPSNSSPGFSLTGGVPGGGGGLCGAPPPPGDPELLEAPKKFVGLN